ncbi:ATP-binding cassette domain-containing protein [Alicyclobacillaceae bacterium I2511]|nr:ATP-binding cassette domain-containing protein [Alicyclobacillaceae bacterium I2511]
MKSLQTICQTLVKEGTDMKDWAVEIVQLTKQLGSIRALEKVSLQISVGSVYGLVGANGAGKTMLLRLISGLYRPNSGEVRVFERPLHRLTPLVQRLRCSVSYPLSY